MILEQMTFLARTVMRKIVHKISFLYINCNFPQGGNEEGRVATPTNFSVFDSYGMKSL